MWASERACAPRRGATLAAFVALVPLGGCAVVAVTGAVVGTAVSVTGSVIGTGVSVGGKVIEKTVDIVAPNGKAP